MVTQSNITQSSTSIITYSPAYTLVPTYECFNRCSYCNFRTDPGKDSWLTLEDAQKRLESLQGKGVWEILILAGEVHPKSPRRKEWFNHIFQLCQLALELGFLPHTNVGPLSYAEMKQLKTVNVSMGLMLEQVTPKLLETVHKNAPSKHPRVRLQQLAYAGELKIPFTTGLLLGIGETEADWWESLSAIAQQHQKWGHIQEVILQPHRIGHQQSWKKDSFNLQEFPKLITKAREILPAAIAIQIPPNLISDSNFLLTCVDAGASDFGGIGVIDEVNPDYPHLHPDSLQTILKQKKWELKPRLPVYPQYYPWLSSELQALSSPRFEKRGFQTLLRNAL
ncbi:FO synthase subunit 1 [Halothece sp. PCC 7418]|uniref:7,8-didemethyl-8-hydroxy-5-deazariboflavin synthase subunit CofG n=1 Tax=Halothece sp. (strain PCC 7418) TaxID=65093 RepID=UPI0002A06FD7|nr:7,8-didemethyl-8-hydroxy-5-deazariboflavin synthase subunit CofG [Halothece sp. PCC 7418]AFZ43114.1 FO synthase subunit 1 [Halothece sp. PCC 7418]